MGITLSIQFHLPCEEFWRNQSIDKSELDQVLLRLKPRQPPKSRTVRIAFGKKQHSGGLRVAAIAVLSSAQVNRILRPLMALRVPTSCLGRAAVIAVLWNVENVGRW